ncbi:tryptophan synthase subunit alpha [Saccharibacillus kuerlensis]|uniref:Tryptophan synthase alpha chain n=1 Tax=Saccharibacillus kuerlensis TaxID=459527 RepID=A0ABQ2L5L2_9BACL|nr:tryptophan synthase subunit alpha [Saccharibacillus kuerlensis]GGO04354.1 tryptophan synthase alpha chain [Saccharibacillus kuerlensis]
MKQPNLMNRVAMNHNAAEGLSADAVHTSSVSGNSNLPNLIEETFQRIRKSDGTALIPFLTVGDPDIETTLEIIEHLEQAGADVLELGVPYSDPLADGPVIQRASSRALQQLITVRTCLDVASKARARGVKMPFVLFTYYNPVLQMGLDDFFAEASKNEISGLIIPDLPHEEAEEMRERADRVNIALIPLIAPTSIERIGRILDHGRGFVYCVSSLGVTGERASFHEGVDAFIRDVRSRTDLPVAVGFGISSREQVERFSELCDGVVVGSAIVRTIESLISDLMNADRREDALLQIREFVAELKV